MQRCGRGGGKWWWWLCDWWYDCGCSDLLRGRWPLYDSYEYLGTGWRSPRTRARSVRSVIMFRMTRDVQLCSLQLRLSLIPSSSACGRCPKRVRNCHLRRRLTKPSFQGTHGQSVCPGKSHFVMMIRGAALSCRTRRWSHCLDYSSQRRLVADLEQLLHSNTNFVLSTVVVECHQEHPRAACGRSTTGAGVCFVSGRAVRAQGSTFNDLSYALRVQIPEYGRLVTSAVLRSGCVGAVALIWHARSGG